VFAPTDLSNNNDEGESPSSIIKNILKEKFAELQQCIKDMSISRNEIWCTIFSSEGNTKEYYKLNDALHLAVWRIQIETFCDIYEGVTNHAIRDCPRNLRNARPKWCHICEENNHSTQECRLNKKNKMKIHAVYQKQMDNQNVNHGNGSGYKVQGDGGYEGRGGHGGGWRQIGRGHGRGRYYLFKFFKEDHISPNFPIKKRIDMKLCNICGVRDHSLEDFSIVLEKGMNKRNVNLLHTVPKQEILNSKNIHVVTWLGVGEEIYPNQPSQQRGYRNTYPDPEHEEKLMWEEMEFFNNIKQHKLNGNKGG